MFERFTDRARTVVVTAGTEATALRHPLIGTEHLLLGLLAAGGVGGAALAGTGVTAERVRTELTRLVAPPLAGLTPEDAAALRTIGIDLDTVLARLTESFGPHVVVPPARRRGFLRRRRYDNSRFGPRARTVLELSLREALRLGDHHIGTEHILLGLIREGRGLAAQILATVGIDLDELRTATLDARRRVA